MRGIAQSFLGTLLAVAFVVGVIAFIAWREERRGELEQLVKKRAAEREPKPEGFGGADPSTVSEGGNYHPREPVVASGEPIGNSPDRN